MKLPHYNTAYISGKSILLIVAVLTLFPPLYLAAVLYTYTSDVPWNDQWDFAATLGKFYSGTLGLGDLWAFHNEHRIIVARVVLLAIAWLTSWDLRAETVVNAIAGVAIFALLWWRWSKMDRKPAFNLQMRPSSRRFSEAAKGAGSENPHLLLPVLSTLVFSLSQWQSWFFGWQLCVFLQVLAVLATFSLLAGGGGWKSLVGAIVCAVIGTFSFGMGLMVWPAGWVALELRWAPRQWSRRLAWWFVGIAVLVAYVQGYAAEQSQVPASNPVFHPVEFLAYFFAFIGAPIVSYSVPLAVVSGILGLILVITLVCILPRRGIALEKMVFYVTLAVFVLAGAALTAHARSGFGASQALSSRYITESTLFWVSAASLTYLWLIDRHKVVLFAAGAVLMLLLAANAAFGTLKWTERYEFRLPARAELVQGSNPDLLQRLHPDPSVVMERRDIMRKYGLGVFHD